MKASTVKEVHTLRVTENVPRAVALAFLRCDPRENVFLISRIQHAGMSDIRNAAHGRFLGAYDGDQSLRGLCFLSNTGTLILTVDEPWVAAEFVDPIIDAGYTFGMLVTTFDAGREFLGPYKKKSGRKPVLDRKQIWYVLEKSDLQKGIKEIDMEQASLDSIDELTDLACAMVSEDFKLKVEDVDRRHYRLRMTERAMDGRAFICREDAGRPLFKADLSVVGPEGALVEGVFTQPDRRKEGIATRGLFTLCKDILGRDVPFISLHVDERNKAARAVYEKVGFREVQTYRLSLLNQDV